jgi:two-component sensor histidine kinase/FixJ family two-component response regulator
MPIKALLVEDSPADVRMIQELLRQSGGRQVLLQHSGRVSTALASLAADRPDVLLLDLRLPDSQGLDTFRRVQDQAAAIPIIILTGLDDIDMAVESIAEGAADYLLKGDLSAGLLLRVMRYGIERKRVDQTLRRTEKELAFKNEIANAFLTAPDQEMAPGVLRAMLEFMQSEQGAFGYIDRDGSLICPAVARARPGATEILRTNRRLPRSAWNGIWGRSLAEKRPLLLNEPTEEIGGVVQRALAVPLLDRGELIGLFEVADKPADYDSADREFLERSAEYLAPILHARLQREEHEKALSAALASAETLLKEVHHRVKNNLQIISSLLNMRSDGLPAAAQGALEESQQRVRSMALVHEQLYSRERPDQLDFEDYIACLTSELFSAYSHSSGILLRLDLEPVLLGIDQAIPCGLILNELVTNSLKYGFPEIRSGEIAVELHCIDENRVRLRVADNGAGFPPDFDWRKSESLGLRIVNILTAQLNGTLHCAVGGGVAFTLTFTRDQPRGGDSRPGGSPHGQ